MIDILFQLAVFLFFSLLMMSGTRTQKKTADEIPVEGNCQRFSQGASVWSAWGGPVPWFIGRKWKRRRVDSGLFRIYPRALPLVGGFSEFLFVADKLIFKISYSVYFDYFSTFYSISWLTMELKMCRFRTIPDSATRSTSCRRFFKIHLRCGESPTL